MEGFKNVRLKKLSYDYRNLIACYYSTNKAHPETHRGKPIAIPLSPSLVCLIKEIPQ
jgi:hypothetical protein